MANILEETLKDINREKIQLNQEEIERNNALLKQMTEYLIAELKKDAFFKSIYERFFFGGSYYDGLKVGKPNEFDIDLLFKLPLNASPTIRVDDNYPGFVQVQLPTIELLRTNPTSVDYSSMRKLVNDGNYLSIDRIMKWFQSRVDIAKNALANRADLDFAFSRTSVKNKGPAITFTIRNNATCDEFDVDFVPCFKFFNTKWPANCKPFRRELVDSKDQLTQEFLVVPKPKDAYSTTYMRLSFQGQERVLIHDKGHLKAAIRLLKLYRDKEHDEKIKSYYFKTMAMWALEDPTFRYKNATLSSIFMQLLERYINVVGKKKLQYYWNPSFNLFQESDATFLRDLHNRLLYFQKDLKSGNADKIKKHFGCDVDVGSLGGLLKGLGIKDDSGASTSTDNDQGIGSTVGAVAGVIGAGAIIGLGIWRALAHNNRQQNNQN